MSGAIVFGGHSTAVLELGSTRLVADPLLRQGLFLLLRRHVGILWPRLFTRPAEQFSETMARVAPQIAAPVLRPGERLALAELRA